MMWGWGFLGLLLTHPLPGTGGPGRENGVPVILSEELGGSVAFHLTTSQQFTRIIWYRSATNEEPSIVTILTPGEQCKPGIWDSDFKERLDVAEDCRSLEIHNLTLDDSGSYTAQIQLPSTGDSLKEAFELQVHEHLKVSDLIVQCYTGGDGNKLLKCSVRSWGKSMVLRWENINKEEHLQNYILLELSGSDPDLNHTCTAMNPLSRASKTVSVKEVCDGKPPSPKPTMGPIVEEGPGGVSSLLLGVTVAVMVVAKVMISACVLAKWPCCPGKERLGLLKEKAAAQERSMQPPRPSLPKTASSRQ